MTKKNRTIVQPFFLTKVDEDTFSKQLREKYPSIKFVDDSRWETPEPVLRDSIAECESSYAFLWPSDIFEELPVDAYNNEFEGPQTGFVMQFMRSRSIDNCLLSGQIGGSFFENDIKMKEWARSVINILRRSNVAKLRANDESASITGAYVVGADAVRFANEGGQLQYNSRTINYEVV